MFAGASDASLFNRRIPLPIPIQGIAPLLEVFDMARSIAFYRNLRAHGVDAEAPVTQAYGMRQVYVTIPMDSSYVFSGPIRGDVYGKSGRFPELAVE